ncbi:hypothetical protein [Pseudomonas izuensis]|uniref:hypothetical protein n=1 Tax=Pseudomonas izuensis TaxID=2684212 RepID=UPI00135ABA12|nr:hypothetical protein [Pseudomonas izuensis]
MLNASTVAMPRTVKTPLKTKQAQEKFICADQIGGMPAAIRRVLIWFFSYQVNL